MSMSRPTQVADFSTDGEAREVLTWIAEYVEARCNDASLLFARKFKGGWEKWLQVELATYLQRKFDTKTGGSIDVRRERQTMQMSFSNNRSSKNGRGSCDLWISPIDQNDMGTIYCIELKCAYEKGQRHDASPPTQAPAQPGNIHAIVPQHANPVGTVEIEYLRERMLEDMQKLTCGFNDKGSQEVKGHSVIKLAVGFTSYDEFGESLGPDHFPKNWRWENDVPAPDPSLVKYKWLVQPNEILFQGKAQNGLAMVWWTPPPPPPPIASATFENGQRRSTRVDQAKKMKTDTQVAMPAPGPVPAVAAQVVAVATARRPQRTVTCTAVLQNPPDATKASTIKASDHLEHLEAPIAPSKNGPGFKTIVDLLVRSLQNKWVDGSIKSARRQKGGWECWLQVALSVDFLMKISTTTQANAAMGVNTYAVDREEQTWAVSNTGKSVGSCDIILTPGQNYPEKNLAYSIAYFLELKLAYESTNEDNQVVDKFLIDRYLEDVQKVNGHLTDKWQKDMSKYAHSMAYCVGVTSYKQDIEDARWSKGKAEKGSIKYITITEDDVDLVPPDTKKRKAERGDTSASPQRGLWLFVYEKPIEPNPKA